MLLRYLTLFDESWRSHPEIFPSYKTFSNNLVCVTPLNSGNIIFRLNAIYSNVSIHFIFQIKTFAKSDGDDYVINGSKFWITNGHNADWCCLLVNTNDGPVHKSKSLVCVPMDTPGVVRGKRIEKIGMRSSDTAQLFFEDVRIPKKNIIGQEGKGFIYQMQQFQQERIYCVAITLKALELVINETIDVSCVSTAVRTIHANSMSKLMQSRIFKFGA